MRVILIRHGDAVGSTGRFHGWIDNPLTPKGAKEASDIADVVKQYNPTMMYSSPMQRARASASIISQKLGIPMQVNNALKPLNLGIYDGKSVDKYADDVHNYLRNPNQKVPSGESVNDWAGRFIPFLNQYLYNKSPQTIAMLTHGRNIILAKADRETGNNPYYNQATLIDNKKSTEHGGYAVVTPDSFEIKSPKSVDAGTT